MQRILALLVFLTSLAACSESFEPEQEGAFHPLDTVEVDDSMAPGDTFRTTFDRQEIMSDAFFEDSLGVDAEDVQYFFENSPYNGRSWLADERIDGRRAADVIVEASNTYQINPILLLIRLQVEQGLVSPQSKPTQRRIDRALGCGCHDGSSCASQFRGFAKQMMCGAEAHRRLFDQSMGGGAWAAGKTKRTLDPLSITPKNHATASLYAYTPWVLQGQGGNWLVWNIGRRFVNHLAQIGTYTTPRAPFIGTPCLVDADCGFTASGARGSCYTYRAVDAENHGFCTIACAGSCPDRTGEATTFCIELEVGRGQCVSKAEEVNDQCSDLPGTRIEERDRFIGTSGATRTQALVCAPDFL